MSNYFTRIVMTALMGLATVTAIAQETERVTAPAVINMPVRPGNNTNYMDKGSYLLELWSNNSLTIPDGYYVPMRFDMTQVAKAKASGKVVKSARLRLTHCGDNQYIEIALRPFAASTEWSASSTLADMKALVETAYAQDPVVTGGLTFAKNMLTAATAAFADGTYAMSDYQSSIDVTDYVKANATANDLNVMITNIKVGGSKAQLWSCNPKNDMIYNNSKFKDNWEAMLKAFSMTEDEFVAAVTPTIDVELATPSSVGSAINTAVADCWLRAQSGNEGKNNNTEQMETWTASASSSNAYGLVGFEVPAALAYKDITTVNSATVRLVTRRYSNDNQLDIYAYGNDFDETTATYTSESDYVSAALQKDPIATIGVTGQKGKYFNSATGDYQDITKWTNNIDLTSYLNDNTVGSRLNLFFKPKEDNNNIQIYSHSVTDKTFASTDITVPSADLVPQLTVSYTVGYTLTIGEAGAATLCLPFEAQIPDGVKAYRLTGIEDRGERSVVVTKTVDGTLPVNTPVLVVANAGSYELTAVDATVSASEAQEGVLTGSYEEKVVPEGGYILTYNNGKLAFRSADGATNKVDPYRAYLVITSSKAKTLTFDFDDTTVTGVSTLSAPAKPHDANVYSLSGQRLAKDAKGLVVRNGKAVIMR